MIPEAPKLKKFFMDTTFALLLGSLFGLLVWGLGAASTPKQSFATPHSMEVEAKADPQDDILTYLTPYDSGDAEAMYLNMIDRAEKTIYLCAYGFTDQDVTDALIAAKRRGVDIHIVMDSTEAAGVKQKPLVKQLRNAGIEVIIGKSAVKNQLCHAKFTVFDGKVVESGSFNYSKSASEQDNFVDIITSPERAKMFTDFWQKIHDHMVTGAHGE